MEATHKRVIQDGLAYDRFFPRAEGGVYTVRENASLEDTVAFIPKVVYRHLDQTRAIAEQLKGRSRYDTCSNIWDFVYHHIQYEKDKKGFEQIRSPARAWHDRRRGVDCDCYSVFISTILLNLGIPHLLRITKYRQDFFQHIYPVVPVASGEIIIDCVTNDFNYEVPYSAKKDFPMDLQFLNGIDDPVSGMGDQDKYPPGYTGEIGELGKFRLKVNLKKVLNVVNRFNPATILLRNGLLASMKLNIGGVAKQLRWSYMTPAQAAAKGISAQKLHGLVKVRTSLEKIFYGAGGKLNNLKKAILKGKGNKDKAVLAGLGSLDFGDIDRMGVGTPLEQLLGPDIYYSENERSYQGFKGFGALGEPVTLASITAASGVIVKLVAALKKVGGIFGGGKSQGGSTDTSADDTGDKQGDPGGSSTDPVTPAAGGSETATDTAAAPSDAGSGPASAAAMKKRTTASTVDTGSDGGESSGDTAASSAEADDTSAATAEPVTSAAVTTPVIPAAAARLPALPASTPPATGSFWQQNKSWLKPVAIGVGGITLLAIGYHMLKPTPHRASPPLSGVPGQHKRTPRKTKKKKKMPAKRSVALL
ncbi:transglutaminase-like domain-containing protein [Puia dinghuensis]|uniref:Transglutaminase-like domain-containing protein n=1 Tax=Puia dinghuensis TaxID=1792502 RepID=A0A8J2UAB5_9BACT|nr:transglutaminase-like domain-containing protein [Puia dinghuensis]GGA90003.1 hypothetical protein GCM10011511_11560 [Puia dinghuensis]